jgi:uncharacterized protein
MMQYLVDGHNLIPKIGLRLDSFEDEEDLIAILQEFCRLKRVRVDVYFDKAPAGFPALRKAGAVTAHFIRQGSSADAAIEKKLVELGNAARNWTVVSSDRRVQRAAGALHAAVVSSEEFASEVTSLRDEKANQPKQETTPSPEQVEEWLEIFKKKRK